MTEIISVNNINELTRWLRLVSINYQNSTSEKYNAMDELVHLVQKHQLEIGDLFLLQKNGIAKCAARYDSKVGSISDVSSLPGERVYCVSLIDRLIQMAKEDGHSRVSCWISGNKTRIAGLLNQFTFDTRRIRFVMQFDMHSLKEQSHAELTVREYSKSNPSYHPHGPERESFVSIYEMVEFVRMNWAPRLVGSFNESHGPVIVAFTSRYNPRSSIIRLLNESFIFRDTPVFKGLMLNMLHTLNNLGINHVEIELDGDYRVVDCLKSLGFVRNHVIVELSLPLLY